MWLFFYFNMFLQRPSSVWTQAVAVLLWTDVWCLHQAVEISAAAQVNYNLLLGDKFLWRSVSVARRFATLNDFVFLCLVIFVFIYWQAGSRQSLWLEEMADWRSGIQNWTALLPLLVSQSAIYPDHTSQQFLSPLY